MGKILYTQHREKGDVNYIAGNVTFVNEGLGEYEGRVVHCGMTLRVWDPEKKEAVKKYLSVSFFNNEVRALRDNFIKAKVGVGDFILITAGAFKELDPAKDGTPRISAIGFAFARSGIVKITNGEKKYNVVVGTARKIRDVEENSIFNVSIPVSVYNKDESKRNDVWYGLGFMDSDNRKLYKAAKGAISNGVPLAALCGEVRENNGFLNLNVFQFVTGIKREAKTE